MRIEPINSEEFLEFVVPAAATAGADGLARLAAERWTPQQITELIYEPSADVRKLACMVLGLIGDNRSMPALAAGLCDLDAEVHAAAENAAWSIWFRSGTRDAQRHFAQGLMQIEHDAPGAALQCFRQACKTDPTFAEAFNQCGLVHYMLEQWTEATAPCRRALQLQPWHFAAMAGLGHCYVQVGDLEQAACCYRRALAINPRMEAVSHSLKRIEQCLGVRDAGDDPANATSPPPPPPHSS